MKKIKLKLTTIDKFIIEISKIKGPEIFLGVARVLKVKVVDEKNEPLSFETLFREVLKSYEAQSHTRQKELLSILKAANAAAPIGGINGNNSKHPKDDNTIGSEDVREVSQESAD